MEGLEIAETKLSNITNVIDYRIEAEYFSSKFLLNDKKLATIKTHPFMEVATFINGRPYASESFNYYTTGVRIAKIGDVTNKRDIDSWEFIDIDEFNYQKGQLLTSGDILMTLTGDPPDIGKVNYIDDPINASWNQRVARVRLIPEQKYYIGNDVLYIILSTEIVRIQLERYAKGIRQRNLGNESLDRLLLPDLSYELQLSMQNCVKQIYLNYNHSKCLYTEAMNILLDNLKIKDCNLADSSPSIKSVKDSFVTSGRLDAEYYQPKYDEIIRTISQYPYGHDKIGNLYILRDKNFLPDNNTRYKYIELSDIGVNGEISGSTYEYGSNLPSRARRVVHTGDIIISSIEGSLQSCAIITEEYDGALCSTGFYVLSPRSINSETSLVLFKSAMIQTLLQRACTGTILTAINKEEFVNISLPIIDNDTQNSIAVIIKRSTSLRQESKRLLNLAKTVVETAIEQGESAAMELLN